MSQKSSSLPKHRRNETGTTALSIAASPGQGCG
jgi:hypothetical protein